MAHKKGMGSTRNGRDSISKRLGVKIYGGQHAINGNIIVRQRGSNFHEGEGVRRGKDFTLYAVRDGIVHFRKKANDRTYVSVLTEAQVEALANGTLIAVPGVSAAPKKEAAPKKDKKAKAAEAVVEETVAVEEEVTEATEVVEEAATEASEEVEAKTEEATDDKAEEKE